MNRQYLAGGMEMVGAMVLSGTIGWFVLTSGLPVADVIFWRCLFGVLALGLICGLKGYFRAGIITPRQALLAALSGAAIVLNWLFLFSSFPRATIAVATTVYNVQPFMLMGLGAVIFREKVTAAKLTWMGLAFLGMVAIVLAKPHSGASGSDYLTGIAFALVAAFLYAIGAAITKHLKGVPPHLVALFPPLVGVAVFALMRGVAPAAMPPVAWGAVVALGLVHTGLMYVLLYSAIQKLPTHLTGILSFVYPVVTIVVDYVAYGYWLRPVQLAGVAAILGATAAMSLGLDPWRRRAAAE